jgi:hypothetical protein
MVAGTCTRLLRTGAKACFFTLFRPPSSDRPLTSRRLHSVFFLLTLLVMFAPVPAQGECWRSEEISSGTLHGIFGPYFITEFTHTALEGLNSLTQKRLQYAASITPSIGCSLNSCSVGTDLILYYNYISPPLPQEYHRTVQCEYYCPITHPLGYGPAGTYFTASHLNTNRAVDYLCGDTSLYVIKLSNDASPPASGALAEVEPGLLTTTLRARVYDSNGQLVPSANVKLEITVDSSTGGHGHHDSSRPKGLLLGNGQAGIEIFGNTDSAGLPFFFNAPAPAGDHKITATCTDPSRTCTQEGPDKVWVGIRGLVNIPSSGFWNLYGDTGIHPAGHYLTGDALGKLMDLAQLYTQVYFPLNTPVLQLNDASLERGGVFDIDWVTRDAQGNIIARRTEWWTPPHKEHQRGVVVDIQANGSATAIPRRNFRDFEFLMRNRLGMTWLYHDGHYHVRLLGVAQ